MGQVNGFLGSQERVEGKEGRETLQCRVIQEAPQNDLSPGPSSWVLACCIQVFSSDTYVHLGGQHRKASRGVLPTGSGLCCHGYWVCQPLVLWPWPVSIAPLFPDSVCFLGLP